MEYFVTLIVVPIIVAILGLVIEYWIIQPIKQKQEEQTAQKSHILDISSEFAAVQIQDKQISITSKNIESIQTLSSNTSKAHISESVNYSSDVQHLASFYLQLLYIFNTDRRSPITFSPDGRFITYVGFKRWRKYLTWQHLQKNRELQVIGVPIGSDWIYDLFYSANGKYCIETKVGEIRVWNIEEGKLHQQLDTYANDEVAISNDGNILVTAKKQSESLEWIESSSIEVWRVRDGGLIYREKFKGISGISMDPSGRYFAFVLLSKKENKEIMVGKINNDSVHLIRRTRIVGERVHTFAFSPHCSTFSYFSDGKVNVYNLEKDEVDVLMSGPVNSIAYSPDAKSIITGGTDCTLRLWDLESSELRLTLRGHSSPITAIKVSINGQIIASQSDNGIIRFWKLSDGHPIGALKNFESQVIFGPDAKTFASTEERKQIIGHFIDLTLAPIKNRVKVWHVKFPNDPEY